jgi:hypothetical protein
MKRASVFLLLGPASVVFAVWVGFGAPARPIVAIIAMILFLLISLPSAMAGLVDGCLARKFPILVRAPLTAIAGSALAVGFARALIGVMPRPDELIPFAIGSALYMGVCSLLSHDYGISRLPRPRHGLPASAG